MPFIIIALLLAGACFAFFYFNKHQDAYIRPEEEEAEAEALIDKAIDVEEEDVVEETKETAEEAAPEAPAEEAEEKEEE